ncbi:hypothetical protein SMICM304S_05348 [Streptomyces microflavus]
MPTRSPKIRTPSTPAACMETTGPITHRAIQPDGTETWLILGHPEAERGTGTPIRSFQ